MQNNNDQNEPIRKVADRIDKHVGQRIHLCRKQADLTQAQVANSLGVTYQTIQKYERGTSRITAGQLMLIARSLNVDVCDLYKGVDSIINPHVDTAVTHALKGLKNPSIQKAFVELIEEVKKTPQRGDL